MSKIRVEILTVKYMRHGGSVNSDLPQFLVFQGNLLGFLMPAIRVITISAKYSISMQW